jgi:hypothetical protein
MSSVVIAGNTSGTVTLNAPDISGSTVLTLPTTSGTLVTTAGGTTVPFALGSASAPSITFIGDTNTGIFSPGADSIGFAEGGAEIARFDSSGQFNVGPFGGNGNAVVAGSSSPGFTNQPGTNLLLKSGDGSGTGSSFMSFSTSPAGSSGTTVNTAVERMRIDSSGNLGIGTTATTTYRTTIANNGGNQLRLYATDVSTTTTNSIDFWYLDGGGSPYNNTAIRSLSTANAGNGNLVFYTRPTSGSLTERMRISSGGNVSVTQPPGTYTCDVTSGATSIANNGTVDYTNAGGLLIANNYSTGAVTVYIAGGGSVTTVANTGGQVGTFVYVGGIDGYRWTNTSGSTSTFGFFFIRTRPNG